MRGWQSGVWEAAKQINVVVMHGVDDTTDTERQRIANPSRRMKCDVEEIEVSNE